MGIHVWGDRRVTVNAGAAYGLIYHTVNKVLHFTIVLSSTIKPTLAAHTMRLS